MSPKEKLPLSDYKENIKLKSSSYMSKPVDVSIFIFESFVSQSNWKKWEDIGLEW
jgi:hypothetical protein